MISIKMNRDLQHARDAIARGDHPVARRHLCWASYLARLLPSRKRRIANLRIACLQIACNTPAQRRKAA